MEVCHILLGSAATIDEIIDRRLERAVDIGPLECHILDIARFNLAVEGAIRDLNHIRRVAGIGAAIDKVAEKVPTQQDDADNNQRRRR